MAVVVHQGPVPVDPDIGEARPVGLQVAPVVLVLPETPGHADPGGADGELAHLVAHGPALLVEDDHVHPGAGRGERGRLGRPQGVVHEDAAADLGAAGVVDDGDPPLSHLLEEPAPGLRVPGLAGGAEGPQPRQVPPAMVLRSPGLEDPHQGGGESDLGQAPALGHRPDATGVRVVGGPLVEEAGGAEEAGAEDQPGAHHPAHVRDPVDQVPRADVESEAHVLGRLHRESAVGVDGSLGAARGPGGVEDHHPLLRLRVVGGALRRLVRHQPVPPVVPSVAHVDGIPGVPQDQDRADLRQPGEGGVGDRLQGDRCALAGEAVGGDQGRGAGVGEAGGDGSGAEAGEQGKDHAADADHRQQGDDDLRRHRQQEADAVPGPDAQGPQGVGAASDLGRQLRVGERPHLARLRLGDHRGSPRALGGLEPAVEAVDGDVHAPAGAPAGEGGPPAQVDDAIVRGGEPEAQEPQDRLGEAGHIAGGPGHEIIEVGRPVELHEPLQVGPVEVVRLRGPEDAVGVGQGMPAPPGLRHRRHVAGAAIRPRRPPSRPGEGAWRRCSSAGRAARG